MREQKLNIVIVGPAYPYRGGLATYNLLLAQNLQKQGHQVKIITFSLQYPNLLFPGKTQFSTEPCPDNIHIEQAINSVNPVNWYRVGKRLQKEKPDLVVFRYWMSFMAPAFGTIARIIKKNNHSRLIAITDNIIPHEKHFFDQAFTPYFLKPFHGFVTMSKAVLEDLKKFKIQVPSYYTPHPMYESFGEAISKEEAKKKLDLDADKSYLLFFGFIRKYKGLDLLLEVFADERIAKKNIQLIIAGEYYESPQSYEQLIEKYQLKERLVLRNDFIPDSEVVNYFCAADMVVQTYKEATQSGVTQIAYFYDKPMLVTNVGGLAELVPHLEVGYVLEKNKDEIVNAILDFYDNQREKIFKANVKKYKENFSWNTMIKTLLKTANLENNEM